MTPFQRAVAEVIEGLRVGDVLSYGDVAAEAGYPGRARAVGRYLADHGGGHAWWRVVRADGSLAPHLAGEQARRLRAEGVRVVAGRVRG